MGYRPAAALLVLCIALTGCTTPADDAPPSARNIPPLEPPSQVAAAELPADADAAQPAKQSEPIAATDAAGTTDFANAFDQQLGRLANNQPPQQLDALPADQRELASAVLSALQQFRVVARDDNAMLAAKTAPLVALSDQLKAQAPLTIPTLAVCRKVDLFGVYEPFEPATFTTGHDTPVIVYCEIENFLSRLSTDARWETKLSYEAVVYQEGESPKPVITKKPAEIVDLCRNKRRDFFLADRMTIPAALTPGKYLLKVTVIDQQANRIAEKTLPIGIQAQ
jgi:hypothetical protein